MNTRKINADKDTLEKQRERELREQISEHRGYIYDKNLTQATGAHFNLPGHQLSDMKVTVLEKVKKFEESYRKERESFYIRIFNTFYRGINRRPKEALQD